MTTPSPGGAGPPAGALPDLLDSPTERHRRLARIRRANTQTVPALRLVAVGLLVLAAVLHNAVLLDGVDGSRMLWYAAVMVGYALTSWVVLLRWYRVESRVDLGLVFLVLDLVPLALTVYVTGATRSWLFWVLLFRVADQTTTNLRRTTLFSHLAVAAYVAVVAYVAMVEGRPISWPEELVKALFLYLGALYIALIARTAERRRERLRSAVHVARASLAELSGKSSELEAARERAEAASRAKSEFLSRASHELRTPMNAILGFAQLLDMEQVTDEQRAHVREILESGRHLLGIINEVMDIARVETGALAAELQPVAVKPALDDVLRRAAGAARGRGVELPRVVGPECDAWVMAHERKLRQVFANLISNAIRFNRPDGKVEVECSRDDGTLRVSVSDTGPGLTAEQLEEAFTPFTRLDPEHTSGGAGLGLPLARALVEAMDGRFGVNSEPGVGSTFWFELLLTEAPASGEAAGGGQEAGARTGRDRVVLYIDDKPDNVALVRRILSRRRGVELVGVGTGAEGLEAARERQPDLILLDMVLPDHPGAEVLARLRDDQETRAIPVVIVSAEAAPENVGRLLSQGAHAYLTMPYDVTRFLAVVDELLGLD